MTTGRAVPAQGRIYWLDASRGLAVIAMVIYHFSWDLSHFGVIETDVAFHPAWRLFAKAIAASFLALAGFGLVLAHGGGIRWAAFLKRLAILSGAALLVTIGSYFAFPQSFIFFGILHTIALSTVLALGFLRAPWWVLIMAGVVVFVLPDLYRADMFSAPWLLWTGLGTSVPATNDYEPIFPWFAYVLWGMAGAKQWLQRMGDGASPPRRSILSWLGRWSLPIYLIHQPVLFGAVQAAFHMGWL